VSAPLPATVGARPGRSIEFILFAEHGVRVEAVAVVPLVPSCLRRRRAVEALGGDDSE
jgi:hypothetical protein